MDRENTSFGRASLPGGGVGVALLLFFLQDAGEHRYVRFCVLNNGNVR
jgi:hypothetical protein